MSKNLIRLSAVETKVGFKKSFIFEAVRNGTFPQPIRLGHRKTLWVEDEIDAWIQARIQERQAALSSRKDVYHE